CATGRQYTQKPDWEHAPKWLRALKKMEPDTLQFHIQLGENYSQIGAYDAAEDEYIAAMNKQVGSATASAPANSSPRSDANMTANSGQALDAALALSRFYTDIRGLGCEKGLPAARVSLNLNPND